MPASIASASARTCALGCEKGSSTAARLTSLPAMKFGVRPPSPRTNPFRASSVVSVTAGPITSPVTGSTRGWPEPIDTGGRVGAVAQAVAISSEASTRPSRGLGALRFLSDGERDVIF